MPVGNEMMQARNTNLPIFFFFFLFFFFFFFLPAA
jgi:hypothetical protein